MGYIEHLFVNLTYKNQEFDNFYSALVKEIEIVKTNYQFNIKTIYIATKDFLFLSEQELLLFLNLMSQFISNSLIEYSFEIGYQTLKQEHLLILKQFKINRLVWRVRTFNSSLLLNLNRKFNSNNILNMIKDSIVLDYDNFSIDLEDNIPKQTSKDIINDLKMALTLTTPHISYQSHNDYYNHQNKKIISQFLSQNNYHNYEFFSFALAKKYYAQQTLAYLNLKNWYGLGPNATSFLQINDKKFTISNNRKIPWNSKKTILNNFSYYQLLITQSLMLQKGIFLDKALAAKINPIFPNIEKLISKGYLQIENSYLKATNQGWLLLNDVLIDII